eukprot:139998-Hanusia_phi.AAC.2
MPAARMASLLPSSVAIHPARPISQGPSESPSAPGTSSPVLAGSFSPLSPDHVRSHDPSSSFFQPSYNH